jgi:hypothetical protein
VKRAERTPSIVAADRIAGTLGLTLAALFAELEREPDHLCGRRFEGWYKGRQGTQSKG